MTAITKDADLSEIAELHKSPLQQQTPADEPGRPVFVLLHDALHPRDHEPTPKTSTPDFFKFLKV